MVKFILLLYVCSGVTGKCLPLPSPITEFNNFKGCNIFGHHYAIQSLDRMNPDEVETYKLHIGFSCSFSTGT